MDHLNPQNGASAHRHLTLLFPEPLAGPQYLFKFVFHCWIIPIPVRMKFHGKTAIGLLDLLSRRAQGEAKNHIGILIGRIHGVSLKGSFKLSLSFSCGLFRAMPGAELPQPACNSNLMKDSPFFSKGSLIMLHAFSVTSNINSPVFNY